jgi:hypothetical protein
VRLSCKVGSIALTTEHFEFPASTDVIVRDHLTRAHSTVFAIAENELKSARGAGQLTLRVATRSTMFNLNMLGANGNDIPGTGRSGP